MKASYYFQHDYNAANDVKILFLRQQLGMEGYGIFWYVIEQLAQAGGKLPVQIIPVLAVQMQVSADKVFAVVKNYDLFEIIDEEFFSVRLMNQIEHRCRLSQKRSKAATKRWQLPHGERFSEAWQDWIEHRNQIRKPLTDAAIKKQLKMLAEYSEDDAVKIINQSIQNGWQGLFEIKNHGKQKLDIKSELTRIYDR